MFLMQFLSSPPAASIHLVIVVVFFFFFFLKTFIWSLLLLAFLKTPAEHCLPPTTQAFGLQTWCLLASLSHRLPSTPC